MDKPNPCPFCGGEAEFVEAGCVVGYVRCTSCGVSQRRFRLRGDAIKDWNGKGDNNG